MSQDLVAAVRRLVGDRPGVVMYVGDDHVSVRRVDGGIMHLAALPDGRRVRWALPPDPSVHHDFDAAADPGLLEVLCESFVSNAIVLDGDRAVLGRPVSRVLRLTGREGR